MKKSKFAAMEIWKQKGFTLIEILIVVMVLGILAMIIVPQISVSTQDAKESTLVTNLSALRNSIELYYLQHNNTYPGANTSAGGVASTVAATAAADLVLQMTQYTDVNGIVKTVYDTATAGGLTAKFGPYLRSTTLPPNPFNDKTTVVCDIAIDVITTRDPSGTQAGWMFYTKTGNLVADDGAHDDL